ncbi:MAG: hypothetical protein ABI321_12935 [Polyangia bacterium]
MACLVAVQLEGCGQVVSLLGGDAGTNDASAGLSNGDTCATGPECSSGHCTDNVCCDTACDGVCESCIVTNNKGTCSAVPQGQDPRAQCSPIVANMPDGGADDGGVALNLPDGGVDVMNAKCAGSCNGSRACVYPGASTACGDSFCNTTQEVALPQCDGQGHCQIEPTACVAYTCGPTACKTSCIGNMDCDSGSFCNTLGQCQAQKVQGANCATLSECTSGFCSNGVCCNTDCSQISGGDCDKAGFVGQCKCAPNGVVCNSACQAYYPDLDGDGYGDHNGAAVAGCGSTAPLLNYVANNSDCYDAPDASKPNAKNAFPGSSFRSTANRGDGSYDYDCDGLESKVEIERPGAMCGGCGSPLPTSHGFVCAPPDPAVCTENTTTKASRFMACDLAYSPITGSYNCVGQSFIFLCNKPPCYTYDQKGFNTTVACGAFGTYVECGACNGSGGVTSAENFASRQQSCH